MMRYVLLGALIGTLVATPADAASRERIALDRVQDRPPARIDLMPAVAPEQEMAAAGVSAAPDSPRRSPAPYLRSIAMLAVPAALARTASPLTRRTDAEIRKGEASGQLSKQEARRLRQANNAAAFSAWSGAAGGYHTDAEARAAQGQAEAISSYVFERRFAAKVPEVGGKKDK